ncbi:MAG: hypothetical protein JNM84_10460 [Planctomycetes bacterium]|nr:hypothetical protein [Planctomycetota bacterium]
MFGALALVLIPSLLASEIEAGGVCSSHETPRRTQELCSGCAPQDSKVRIEAERIYYGSPSAWTRAAVIDGSAVVRATAAWKEMEKRGVRRGDPAYELYKNRAEKEARAAIEKVAKGQRPPYDLIGEIGSIVIKGGVVPNLTDEIVLELGS